MSAGSSMRLFAHHCNICFLLPATRFDVFRRSSAIKALTKVKIASSGWDSNHIYSGNSLF